MKRSLLLLFLSVFVFIACQKEEVPPIPGPDPIELDLGSLTTASAYGLITDESGNPVAEAIVTLGNKTTVSDANGVFRIQHAQVRENLTQVKVEKSGYFFGGRSFRPKYEANPFVRIQLLKKVIAGEFESATGGLVELAGQEVAIDFPVDGVVDGSGQPYSGTVKVAIQYLDPTASDLDQRMPGNLLGFNDRDGERVLSTFGMVAVELTGAQDQKLQLADNKPATLTVTVPASLQSNAPASIPLWHFDESVGIWVEEGEAMLENGKYVGKVSHFSFWNCDAPFPVVHMSGSIFLNTNDNPLSGVQVRITIVSSSFSGYGWTDENGVFGGDIPAGEALVLEILDLCGEVVYTENIGPFSADVVLADLILPSSAFTNMPVNISGTLVDCDGNPVPNGYVKVMLGGTASVFYVDNTGAFSGMIQVCSATEFDLLGVDLDNLVQSNTYTFTVAQEVVTGNIEACDVELDEYIQFTLDGEEYLFTENLFLSDSIPGESFFISASGPNQSYWFNFGVNGADVGTFPCGIFYLWESNGTGGTTQVAAQNPGDISVQVTEFSLIPGELIRGTFEGDFLDSQGGSHSVDGTFKVLRDF
ncbi:MAG: hypothetical protein IPL49_15570 [Saprospirales bacterium]|nr:hypothetical protein [Saprospirales bacterium]